MWCKSCGAREGRRRAEIRHAAGPRQKLPRFLVIGNAVDIGGSLIQLGKGDCGRWQLFPPLCMQEPGRAGRTHYDQFLCYAGVVYHAGAGALLSSRSTRLFFRPVYACACLHVCFEWMSSLALSPPLSPPLSHTLSHLSRTLTHTLTLSRASSKAKTKSRQPRGGKACRMSTSLSSL
jgi:hypothetical protein